ncbi:GNAT family N-acetyltransferase [Pedococcus bigeumensis]|jgi:GNAT superfamily N-acetyltransferase|uniref:GNAT family N-acetyltransferase n=1 Tax=Pedococcus bigeumensis TaxID=433644 RepID=UPI002FEB0B5B
MERAGGVQVRPVTTHDLVDLLPLMRAYCTFYETDPADEDLRAMATAFLGEGAAGTQLIARDGSGDALGHATVLWSWDTTLARPFAVMEDLFVVEAARGRGVGAALIEGCRQLAADRGREWLAWVTAPDNATAQRLYDGLAARAGTWLAYRLPTDRPAT